MPRTKGLRPKHVPLRTCVACRQERSKRELVRIVRTPNSGIQVDLTGKLAGRGSYLCRSRACWDEALHSQRLAAALKTTLSAEELAILRAFAATLPGLVQAESYGTALLAAQAADTHTQAY